MSVDRWLERIATLHPKEMDLTLSRVQKVAQRLNVIDFDCPVIVLGGTNGKGSTSAILASIYSEAGYQVGAYTSPHINTFHERIQINQTPITDEALIRAFEKVDQARENEALTYFEFTTLAALYYFKNSNLEVILLEVGLGGRKDAVNVVNRDLSIITTIDYDHMDWLGHTLDEIAFEKAGIFQKGVPAICGSQIIPLVVKKQAELCNAPLYCLHSAYEYREHATLWQFHSQMHHYEDLPKPKLLLQNAATAMMAIEVLQDSLPVTLAQMKMGLSQVDLPGRFEVITLSDLDFEHLCILDVAHNPQSILSLAQRLQAYQRRRIIAVVGMLKDKDLQGSLQPLNALVSQWYVGGLDDLPRGASSEQIAKVIRAFSNRSCYTLSSVEQAFLQAKKAMARDDCLVVFGSFHTVGRINVLIRRRIWK